MPRCISRFDLQISHCHRSKQLRHERINMIEWIVSNIATIIISGVLIVIVAVVIANMIKNKKKSHCDSSGMCSHCSSSGICGGTGGTGGCDRIRDNRND